LVKVPKLWPGSTVAVLATGPSLTQEDCDYLQGKCQVVCVNDAHMLAPWAPVLYSSDRRWWPHHKGVPKFQGLKYGVGCGVRKANPFMHLPDIQVLRNSGMHGLDPDPSALRTGRNSGHAAINLAIHLGAVRVLLLGYNMSYTGGKAHFFGNHPPGLAQSSGLFPGFIKTYQSMVKPLADMGVEVINCTERTSLHCFPEAKLRDVLKAKAVAA